MSFAIPRRLLRSAAFRLVVVYVVLFSISVAILLGFIWWSTAGVLSEQVDETIMADIKGLAEQYEQSGTPGVAAIISERVRRDPGGRTVYLLTDPLHRRLVGNISSWPSVKPDASGWMTFELVDRNSIDGRPYLARARPFTLQGGLNLLVGREIRELQQTREMMINAMIWGLGITIALALAGGIAMSRSTTRRIEAINETSREIMSGDLARRIPTRGSNDEFDQLATNLNSMLDRIQSLMDGLRHVSDNIAHDLRTPLTRLRNRLEDLKASRKAGTTPAETIDDALAEADGLLGLFGALLRITQIEAGGRRENFAPVSLAGIAADVAELYEPVAAERDQTLAIDTGTEEPVTGDRDLIFQAIANLVDNAIKYTPPGGAIAISVDGRRVTVADSGPGIPADAHEAVFDRFHRLESSRNQPGSGLGLSLVRAVAQLHDGRVELADNAPGLRATLVFS